MKFKINKGTNTFTALIDIHKKIVKSEKAARRLTKELGGINHATAGRDYAGGIDAIKFDEKPDGWKQVGDSFQKLYYPKSNKANGHIHKKICDLPIVTFDEVNKVVGFNGPQTVSNDRGLAWVKTVGLYWYPTYILMEISEGAKFTPNKDMVELTVSEFLKLNKRHKK